MRGRVEFSKGIGQTYKPGCGISTCGVISIKRYYNLQELLGIADALNIEFRIVHSTAKLTPEAEDGYSRKWQSAARKTSM